MSFWCETEMTGQDHLRGLCAILTVLVAGIIHALPFLMIGAWLTGIQ